MPRFLKTDLCYRYPNDNTPPDDPKMGDLLSYDHAPDRHEVNEVLHFVNVLRDLRSMSSVLAGQKIEEMVRCCPTNIRSQGEVFEWVQDNWTRF